jgi:hypothetical protein
MNPALRKGRDQLEDSRIDNFIFEHTDKFSMLNFVKKGLNICIEDMPVFESGIGHTGRALGSAFPGAKSEGEFFKLQLINGLHNQDEGLFGSLGLSTLGFPGGVLVHRFWEYRLFAQLGVGKISLSFQLRDFLIKSHL